MKTVKVVMGYGSINGTSLQGYFPEGTTYKQLCSVFGRPNTDGDGYKVDAEWQGTIKGKTFTIYNYKTGENYNGKSGLPLSKITDWHIGGNDKSVAVELVKYFNNTLSGDLVKVGGR